MPDAHGIPNLMHQFFFKGGNDFVDLSKPKQERVSTFNLDLLSAKIKRLLEAIPQTQPVHIIINGLDKYRDNQIKLLFKVLEPLCSPRPNFKAPLAKLIVLSRPTVYFVDIQVAQNRSQNTGKIFNDIELPNHCLKEDIRAYLAAKICNHLTGFTHPRIVEDKATKKTQKFVDQLVPITSKAPPFQWAYLVLEALRSHDSVQHIKKWLGEQHFKVKDLDKFYAKVLLRLKSKLRSRMQESMTSILV